MTTLLAVLSLAMLAQIVRSAVPYAAAAIGGVWSERSGVVQIALEGLLLASALAAVTVHHATGSAWAGAAAGIFAAAALAAAHAALVVYAGVDPLVNGFAVNLLAAGLGGVVLRVVYGSETGSPVVSGFAGPWAGATSGPALLARAIVDPTTLAAAASIAATAVILRSTRFGLRLRAAGEGPAAAAAAGIAVERVRAAAIAVGGAIAGIGGVALAYDEHRFQAVMSGGRGFVALAAVVLSRWRPARAALWCLLFGALDALRIVLPDRSAVSHEVLEMVPPVVTLLALALVLGRRGAVPPAGLGKGAR